MRKTGRHKGSKYGVPVESDGWSSVGSISFEKPRILLTPDRSLRNTFTTKVFETSWCLSLSLSLGDRFSHVSSMTIIGSALSCVGSVIRRHHASPKLANSAPWSRWVTRVFCAGDSYSLFTDWSFVALRSAACYSGDHGLSTQFLSRAMAGPRSGRLLSRSRESG